MSKSITNHLVSHVDEVIADSVTACVHRSPVSYHVLGLQETSYNLTTPATGSARVHMRLDIGGSGTGKVVFTGGTGFLATFDTATTASKDFTDTIAPNVSAGTSCGLTFDVVGGFVAGCVVCIDAVDGSHFTSFSCRDLGDQFTIQTTQELVFSTAFYNVTYFD